VLVQQKNCHRVVRDYLKAVIPKWCDKYAKPDAKARPEGRHHGKPGKVSQNNSDESSQGDWQLVMTICVKNRAMSLGSNIK
jgi:hypothetical protein